MKSERLVCCSLVVGLVRGSREKLVLASSYLSARIGAASIGRISVKFDIGDFMKICEKFQISLKSDKNIELL